MVIVDPVLKGSQWPCWWLLKVAGIKPVALGAGVDGWAGISFLGRRKGCAFES